MMSKNNYIYNLSKPLAYIYKYEELEDVLYDYNEYFNYEEESGLNADEICLKLGAQKNVAKEMIKQLTNKNLLLRKIYYISCLAVFVTVYYLSFKIIYNIPYQFNVIYLVACSLMLWLIVNGYKMSLLSFLNYDRNKHYLKIAVQHVTILLITVTFSILINYFMINIEKINHPELVGIASSYLIKFVILVSSTALIYNAVQVVTKSVWYFTVCTHIFGLIGTMKALINMQNNLYSPETYLKVKWSCFTPYVLMMILTIVFAFIIYKLFRKGEEHWMHK